MHPRPSELSPGLVTLASSHPTFAFPSPSEELKVQQAEVSLDVGAVTVSSRGEDAQHVFLMCVIKMFVKFRYNI